MAKVTPPRVYETFKQVKDFLRERYGYGIFVPCQQVLKKHLIEALINVRGSDYRTVKKWMDLFSKFKLIKWIAGEVYEIL